MTQSSPGGFFVQPDDVQALGTLVGRCGAAATYVGSKLSGPTDWGEGGGLQLFGGVGLPLLLAPARAAINELQRIGMENTAKAGTLGSAAGEALGSVAKAYVAHDQKWRAAFDKAYKEDDSPTKVQQHEVTLRGDPTKRFQPVADPYDDPRHGSETPGMERPGGELWEQNWGAKAFREASAIIEKATVSAYIREVAKRICGKDPFNELVILIGGLGYELLGEQAIAFRDAGYSFESIKANIDQGRFEIQETWTGHVSDEARAWLEKYAACCRKHSEFLIRAGERLMNLARLLYLAFETINRALDALIDELLRANLFTDITVGVWNMFKGENPMHIIMAVVANAQKVSDAIDVAHTAVQGFQALGEVLAATGPVQAADWPAEPYKVPEGMK